MGSDEGRARVRNGAYEYGKGGAVWRRERGNCEAG